MHARWLALFFGLALSAGPGRLYSAPDEPPAAGCVWENLKEIGAWMLRTEGSAFKRQTAGGLCVYYLSPQPFEKPNGVEDGLVIIVNPGANLGAGESADQQAASMLSKHATEGKVIRSWTKKGQPSEPFTTSALVYTYRRDLDGAMFTAETMCVVNRSTDTLYMFILKSRKADWEKTEAWGEKMLASLRLDPKL